MHCSMKERKKIIKNMGDFLKLIAIADSAKENFVVV